MAQVLTEFNILRSDDFLELSAESQLGYIHLHGISDSDGIVMGAKGTLRMAGLKYETVMQELYNAGYILIDDENSSIVIVHAHLHRKFRNDTSTYYKKSLSPTRAKLFIKSDNTYSFDNGTPYEQWRTAQTDEYSNKGKKPKGTLKANDSPTINSVYIGYVQNEMEKDELSDTKCFKECISLSRVKPFGTREQSVMNNYFCNGGSLHKAVEVLESVTKAQKKNISFDDFIKQLMTT